MSSPPPPGGAQPPRGPQHGRSPRPRALRIGVILGGKIIEERLIRERVNVTIGQSVKNTFSVPIPSLPRTWPLFTVHSGRYFLHYTDSMDGRVSDGNAVHTLANLKQHSQHRNGAWVLPLVETARGKLILGEMTLLFQFVTAPPLQPRPRLPASVRGTLADRIDPRLGIILAISLLFHFSIALYALNHDRVISSRMEQLHREFQQPRYKARIVAGTFKIPKSPGKEKSVAKKSKKTESHHKKHHKAKGKHGGHKHKKKAAPSDAKIQEEIRSTAFLKAVTGGAGKSRYAKMSDTDQGADLNKSIQHIKRSGGRVSVGGAGRRTRGPHSGRIGTGHGPRVTGPGNGGGVGKKKEEAIRSRAHFGRGMSFDNTTLDPSKVARRIRERYLRGIQRCHQEGLKRDPRLGGRVELQFTIGPSGRVVKAQIVHGIDAQVDSCIQHLMRHWRFGIPKKHGRPSSATFDFPLILRPGG